ncbi:DNA mismatch repair protein MutS [Candidatus Syntrophocurvum alkaliphilum]|nr:DNA mismatch repair protein MutS [Candidatus Syntrophocurvum alkaliphilum]
MIQQYLEIKERYQDAILFFRLGDFYEMFFEDAKIAAKELEIVLTARDGGSNKIPMCGVPYHSVNNYIHKLINRGYKVAICEQVQDPKDAKGIVKREVTRVITPGTILEDYMLDESENNYLAAVVEYEQKFGLSYIDITTGDFWVTEYSGDNAYLEIENEILRIFPSECLISSPNTLIKDTKFENIISTNFNNVDYIEDFEQAKQVIKDHYKAEITEELNTNYSSTCIMSIAVIIKYLSETHKRSLKHIKQVKFYKESMFVELDFVTRKNLELIYNMKERKKDGTLYNIIDKCCTAMGKRNLKKWIEQPLKKIDDINKRLDAVEELRNNLILRTDTKKLLESIYDLERLVGRIGADIANPKDLLALKNSINKLPELADLYSSTHSEYLTKIAELDILDEISSFIENSINDDAPVIIKEGDIIKKGFNSEIDELRKLKEQGSQWLIEYEQKEKSKTGIKNLKVSFNKVFGYYLEVSKSNLHLVPDDYIRKQTLANTERYITEELKDFETKIITSKDKLFELEYKIFLQIRQKISENTSRIQKTAAQIAILDTLYSMSETAYINDYIRPQLNSEGTIEIKAGRHPVVEKTLANARFVPNNVDLNMDDSRFLIITGPNMGGKSTYMRQIALLVIMTQIGCFIPAEYANIGIVDKIFTRVGASDDLASGQSTFMMEMTEVANIINNSTKNSLIILDEIGRGTSTYDGLSIARAVGEYIHENIGAKTLFATHYHELTSLADEFEGMVNLCVSVLETGDQVVFLKKVLPGKADKSYGIDVAKLAGLPKEVIQRSNDILVHLENTNYYEYKQDITQLSLFNDDENIVVKEIKKINPDDITPKEALNLLYRLKGLV